MRDFYTLADLRNWKRALPPIRLGVFGNPIAHSRSPAMHNPALRACGIELQYARFQIAADELREALQLLPALGFIGVNLTVPHKIAALALLDEIDSAARRIGSTNTIRIDDGRLSGFNTDGAGFSRAICEEFSVDLRDLRVLVLGAGGGAGRAIASQCASENCRRLVLANRTFEKAELLAKELHADSIAWNEEALRSEIANVDLVVNATSLGMKNSDLSVLPASLLAPRLMVYDTIYQAARTPLLQAAELAGARGANGLSMLLHQGALAFERWFDRPAPLEAMRAGLTS